MKITKDVLKDMIAEELESFQEQSTLGALGKGAQSAIRLANRAARGDLTDEEEDFQTARELERATDAGEAITPKQKAAATAARDLPRRSMAQKAQDPALKARGRSREQGLLKHYGQIGRKDALSGQEPDPPMAMQSTEDDPLYQAYIRAYNKAKKAGGGQGGMSGMSEPAPQQSNVRESFKQKGKTKMKLTKNTLKKLIKEELDATKEVISEVSNARRIQWLAGSISGAMQELKRAQRILSNPDVAKRGIHSIHGQKVLARLKAAVEGIESATFELEQAAGQSPQDPETKYDRFPGASLVPGDADLTAQRGRTDRTGAGARAEMSSRLRDLGKRE